MGSEEPVEFEQSERIQEQVLQEEQAQENTQSEKKKRVESVQANTSVLIL